MKIYTKEWTLGPKIIGDALLFLRPGRGVKMPRRAEIKMGTVRVPLMVEEGSTGSTAEEKGTVRVP